MDEQEKKPKPDEGEAPKVSRRSFLKGVGSGALVTSITLPAPSAYAAEAATPPALGDAMVTLHVNDKAYRVKVKSHWTLLDVLRKEVGLTGTKKFCDRGSCGACTVVMDGRAVYSCSRLAIEADNRRIVTIEGLLQGEKLHPIQQAFLENDGLQCGFCTPGQVMATKALLDRNPRPSAEQVREGLSGNICRCSAYPKILKSVLAAVQKA
ncbi:MAG TPA: (2Fe-2S)-binding protein [Burkholderiales bacterium]|nr:(2Fe-2S)-binding protein [Burkholderiales bacterium]